MDKYANLDAEKTLVNQMIIDGSIIPNVYDMVKPETFSTQNYKRCYEVLLTLARKCTPVDELSFRMEAKDLVYPEVIEEVTSVTYTASNWEYYAGEIRNCYTARALRNLLTESLDRLTPSNGGELANYIMSETAKISSNVSACEVHDMNELSQNFIANLDKAITDKREFTGIPTGFRNLDEITLGLQPEYIVIGARPSLGKTALGEQIALNAAGAFGGNSRKKTMFIELEMSPKQLTERAVANLSKVSINKLRTGLLSTQQFSKVVYKAGELANLDNFIPVTCNTRKISDICSCIRREVRINSVEIVFIDHIGLVRPDGNYKNQWEGVAEISHTIQQLQRELNIPIVVLSQVGRAVEGKKPSLADLRGSGAIEEDADTIMFIERDRQDSVDETLIPTVVNINKNRNGACGKANLMFHPQEVMFTDATPEDIKKQEDYTKSVKDKVKLSPAEEFLAGGTPEGGF